MKTKLFLYLDKLFSEFRKFIQEKYPILEKKMRKSNRKLIRTYELETLRFEVDQLEGFSLILKNRHPGSSIALFFTREVSTVIFK